MPPDLNAPSEKPSQEGVTQITPADARTYLADIVDADPLKAMSDEDVVKAHGKYNAFVTKHAPKPESPKVPEKYEFILKDDKGEALQVDDSIVKAFTPVLKKHGVSQEVASELAGVLMGVLGGQDTMITEAFTSQRDSWGASAKTDKEYGGAAFEVNLKTAQKAIAKFGSDEFKTLLDETGLGNHPEFLRLFWKLGKTISEENIINPSDGAPNGGDNARASKLFDHPTSQHAP